MHDIFRKFAHRTSKIAGSPWAFTFACLVIILWAVTGPIFGFSNTWQLLINTGTTILTFLLVVLLQNTQTRDAQTIQLKLDELIRSIKEARDELIDVEDMSDEVISVFEKEFDTYHQHESKGKP